MAVKDVGNLDLDESGGEIKVQRIKVYNRNNLLEQGKFTFKFPLRDCS